MQGSLLDLINATPTLKLPEQVLTHVVHQLMDAIRQIHQKGVAHLDLKPENILLDLSIDGFGDWFCIADFGHSMFSANLKELKLKQRRGTR